MDSSSRHTSRGVADTYSQASTAIAAKQGAAEDGSLHETEFLAHEWMEENARQRLHFSGYLFHRGEVTEDVLRSALRFCQAGGERRYGWGQLSCSVLEPH